MRHRRDVRDGAHFQTTLLDRANRRFTAGSGTLDEDIDFLHAVLLRVRRRRFRSHPCGIGRILSAAGKPDVPALAQVMTLPDWSVIETIVLLKVA